MAHPTQAELLERQNRELAILNAIATALNASVDLSTSLGVALSRVAELLDLRAGWVWLLDETTGEPYLAATQELPSCLVHHPEALEGSCYCLDTFRRGDLNGAANINVVTCSRLHWLAKEVRGIKYHQGGGLKYHASIPLYARGKKLGVMNVASTEWRRLSAEDLRLLHTIGDMVGIAVERARLFAGSAEAGAAEERNRLAREIHDTLAQGLSATALQLETAEALLEGGAEPARIRAAVHRALEATRQNLEEARRSVLDLRAAPLQGRTLAEALAALCARAAQTDAATDAPADIPADAPTDAPTDAPETRAGVRFEVVGGARPLPSRLEIGLFRVAQEALSNALRHAGASHVRVRLALDPERLTLTVADDGRGFDVTATTDGRFGLIGMRERVRLLGGELRLESTPGTGTRVEAVVPLD